MNVKQRLKILALLSLFAITTLTITSGYKEYFYRQKLQIVENLVSFSQQISTTMDNIQNERSMSGIYIQSQGKLLVNELDLQRDKSDKEIGNFKTAAKSFEQNTYLKEDIALINAAIEKLSTTRNEIDRLKLSFEEMLSFYEKINAPMIHIIALAADLSPTGNISKDLSAYYFFTKAKEIASTQKALLSTAIINEKFTQALFDQTIALIAKEQSYLDVFENLAPIELSTFYKTKENMQVFKDSYVFSQKAMEKAKEGKMEADLETWFGMITKKTDILKEIDRQAIEKISNDIHQMPSLALYSVIIGIIFLMVILWVI